MQSVSDPRVCVRWLGFAVLHPDGLRRLAIAIAIAIALKVISKDLLEEYRETSNSSVVDFFDFVAH